MKKSILRKYANLLIKSGLNVQPGQDVEIVASLDQPEFVTMCVEEAYKAKARYVKVNWSYQPVEKLVTNKTKLSRLLEVTEEDKAKWNERLANLPCMLYIESDDPDGLKGMNQERAAKRRQALYKYIKPIRNQMETRYQWCIAAVPSDKWAKKMFPNLSKSKAVEALWDAILKTSRVDDDPILAWEKHNELLKSKCEWLNSLKLDYLHYTSKETGTDFKVWLHPDGMFLAGAEENTNNNVMYNPNIPSEECFTSPLKGKAEGTVYATKPLSYNGEIIDGFSITFKEGKAVKWSAKQNEDLLTKMITMDETSGYLGECALIPYDSPISNLGLLFYSTLFDENASCHLALGMAFTNCIKGFEQYDPAEAYEKLGINDSIIHVDFMIGSKDLHIVGVTKGNKEIEIFKDGNWAN